MNGAQAPSYYNGGIRPPPMGQHSQNQMASQTQSQSQSQSMQPQGTYASHTLTNYAYPGMISQADLTPAPSSQSSIRPPPMPSHQQQQPQRTSIRPEPKERPLSPLTQDESQMEIITASQIDASKHAASPGKHGFGSLGLTQDPQIQDIVSQMNAMNAVNAANAKLAKSKAAAKGKRGQK